MATYSRSRPDQGDESDHAQSSSDVSMEDEENPSKPSPPAQLEGVRRSTQGVPKSSGQFMTKLERAIEAGTGCIEWAEEGSSAISIPNDKKFEDETLASHFGIKPASFDKQLRNYGYQKKKTVRGTEGPGSLWVRKSAPLPNDPTPPNPVQERTPTAGVPVAAGMVTRPLSQLDQEARIDELERELRATKLELSASRSELSASRSELSASRSELSASRSELSASRSELSASRSELSASRLELNATRSELSAARSELGAVRSELNATRLELGTTRSDLKEARGFISDYVSNITNTPPDLLFGTNMVGSLFAGGSPSHPITSSGSDAVVTPSFSQTNEVNLYGGTSDAPPVKDQMAAYGFGNQQAVVLGPEIGSFHNSVNPGFAFADPQSSCESEANHGIPQSYSDGPTMPGGLFPNLWMQYDDGATMSQGAGTSSGHQGTSMPTAGPTTVSHTELPVASLPRINSTSQVITCYQPAHSSGASGGGGRRTVVTQVPFPSNPNGSNDFLQAQSGR